LKEFYAIVNLVSPGSLGSSGSFSKSYEDPIVRSKQPEASRHEIEVGEEKTEELNHLTSQVSPHSSCLNLINLVCFLKPDQIGSLIQPQK
jgi:hypothetical protein